MNWHVPLTAAQRDALIESFHQAMARGDAFSDFFYARLMELVPDLIPQIRTDRRVQQQELMSALAQSVSYVTQGYSYLRNDPRSGLWDLAQRPNTPSPLLEKHYIAGAEALDYAFENVLGDQFSEDARQAWVIVGECVQLVASGKLEAMIASGQLPPQS